MGSTPGALCVMLEEVEGLQLEMLRISLCWDCGFSYSGNTVSATVRNVEGKEDVSADADNIPPANIFPV